MKRNLIAIAIVVVSAITAAVAAPTEQQRPKSAPIKSIPLPPSGQRWVVNEAYSDEFNGTELDKTKWNDHHTNWVGREPGMFVPENIALNDGYLELHGEKMERDTVIKGTTFNVTCAAVTSVKSTAHYGYYECRFKANKSTLSSTFWFSTYSSIPTDGMQPEGAREGMYGQELDVCECIGETGDFKGNFFAKGMNANVHYRYLPKDGGPMEDIQIEKTRLDRADGRTPAEDFNTYGCWWRDEDNVSFYLNNDQEIHREFYGRLKWGAPYDIQFKINRPMHMNIVVETYPYPWITLPTDETLADRSLTTTRYDWVRSYVLVDVDAKNSNAAPMEMFENHINIVDAAAETTLVKGKLPISLHYTSNIDRNILIEIYNIKGKLIGTESVAAYAGYANAEIKSAAAKKIKTGAKCIVVVSLVDQDSKKTLEADSFVTVVK